MLNRAILVFVLCTGVNAHAGAEDDLTAGRQLFSDLQYEAAMPKLAAAKDSNELSTEQRSEAATILAIIQLSLGDAESALRNVRTAVQLDPDMRLPTDASPRLHEMLEQARERQADAERTTLSMQHDTPVAGPGPVTLEVTVGAGGSTTVVRLQVSLRSVGEAAWTDAPMTAVSATQYQVVVPAPNDPGIEYFIQAHGSGGQVLGQVGSAALPLRYTMTGGARAANQAPLQEVTAAEPFYGKLWFWGAIGGSIALIATTAYLLTRDSDSTAGTTCAANGSATGCLEVTINE